MQICTLFIVLYFVSTQRHTTYLTVVPIQLEIYTYLLIPFHPKWSVGQDKHTHNTDFWKERGWALGGFFFQFPLHCSPLIAQKLLLYGSTSHQTNQLLEQK